MIAILSSREAHSILVCALLSLLLRIFIIGVFSILLSPFNLSSIRLTTLKLASIVIGFGFFVPCCDCCCCCSDECGVWILGLIELRLCSNPANELLKLASDIFDGDGALGGTRTSLASTVEPSGIEYLYDFLVIFPEFAIFSAGRFKFFGAGFFEFPMVFEVFLTFVTLN